MVGWTEIGGREEQIAAGAGKSTGPSSGEFYLYIFIFFNLHYLQQNFQNGCISVWTSSTFTYKVTRILVLVIVQVI